MWTSKEEGVLVDILHEMVNTSWKVDTGFKSVYYAHVEKLMEERLPGCGFKADPHIVGKIKTLKKQLGYILEIQKDGSGFGWDDNQKMVIGDKEIYIGWAKSRDQAAALYMKPMLHFDKLCEIYAKDRANGSRDLGPRERVGDNMTIFHEENIENEEQSVGGVGAMAGEEANPTPSSSGKRVRKRSHLDLDAEIGSISKSISSFVDSQCESFKTLSDMNNLFAEEVEVSKKKELIDTKLDLHGKRKVLINVVLALPGISVEEAVKSASLINEDENKIEFFPMDPSVQLVYVRSLLSPST